MVVDATDAAEHTDDVDGVITWGEALACFKHSRLTAEDVQAIPLTKLKVERLLREQGRPWDRFPADWDVSIQRGGSGMPSIQVESPVLPDRRRIRGQVQVTGRGMPASLDETYFEYHIGIQVNDNDDDLPDADKVETAPGWIPHLRTLEHVLLTSLEGKELRLSRHAAGAGQSARGRNKLPLARKFLDGKTWLAKGYTDGWALGIKSTKIPVDDVADLCEIAASIFLAWYQTETAGADRRSATT